MIIDILIFIVYMVLVLMVGVYFFNRNKSHDDYYVAGRDISSWHNGLSVVATDVGGGFSIGLGGLGFTMGLSGSWLLFTGLIGAWMASAWLIPKVYAMGNFKNITTLPQVFESFYGKQVAVSAGIITAVSYLGFTSSQIVAGAKLASGTFPEISFTAAVLIMGLVAVGYTILGGLKAVIYTDTAQWIILISGLLFIGVPFAFMAIGGWAGLKATIQPELMTLTNVSITELINWAITIIPIWFVGMTLYQRIFASRSEKEARTAWTIAGVFEWPIMAFLGVGLGLFARAAFEQNLFADFGYAVGSEIDPEIGLPVLLRTVLPHGFMGLVLASYFSAVMSTADSCLMACSGAFLSDVLRVKPKGENMEKSELRYSQWATLGLGSASLIIALFLQNVLSAMLFSYAFMVSGLLIPILGAFYWKQTTKAGALTAMIAGGVFTTTLSIFNVKPFGLDPNFYGLLIALICFLSVNKIAYTETTKK
ncbi:sodium:solute symporter [Marinoscillum sp. MHG1-6]|uniref:sodium:solute symporter family protein n=1 Tax=Marinoscillum sp. MHG1-6 TaxID=2959627 RepID=UPI002157D208|nr:sodium:solute symporter family protein [Marinoscillum sp. MHG1-6]